MYCLFSIPICKQIFHPQREEEVSTGGGVVKWGGKFRRFGKQFTSFRIAISRTLRDICIHKTIHPSTPLQIATKSVYRRRAFRTRILGVNLKIACLTIV